jgi:laminin alpha 3/5
MLISLVNNRPSSKNFTNSDNLQEWTRATNIRFRLLRTKSLLGHLMALSRQDPSVTRRVRKSIYNIYVLL